ncbi:hypothetical protein VTP01DRAFT_6564 [Rhizomucor pusillus]|uniref:uncharacterized protein n=1 Tax=Rhizomucor pusillus TaxID=4840 RepID=UPI003741F578
MPKCGYSREYQDQGRIQRFNLCCKNGNIDLPLPQPPIEPLQQRWKENNAAAREFRQNVGAYNNDFAFSSLGVTLDETVANAIHGACSFRISGRVSHRIGPMLPENGQTPGFAQTYIYAPEEQINHCQNYYDHLDIGVVTELQRMLLDSGFTINKNGAVTQETAGQEYFRVFNMAKIGYKTVESLETDKSLFWNQIITDGYDLGLVFKKPEKEYQPQDPADDEIAIDDPMIVVLSVDTWGHRPPKLSGRCYGVFTEAIESIEYRMKHHQKICDLYDQKFQKVIQRLLSDCLVDVPNSMKAVKHLHRLPISYLAIKCSTPKSPAGTPQQRRQGPLLLLLATGLKRYPHQKKASTFIFKVDEYLTSQVCPKCLIRSVKNVQDEAKSKLHAIILKC